MIILAIEHIAVRNIAISLVAPITPPRVPHDEDLIDIRIPDTEHGMIAVRTTRCILRRRHRHKALFPLTVKRLEQRHTKNNRMTFCKRKLEVIHRCLHLLDARNPALLGLLIAFLCRLFQHKILAIRPLRFTAASELHKAVNSKTNHRSAILLCITTCFTRIVIHKQAAHLHIRIESRAIHIFKRTDGRIRRAAVHLPLVLDRRQIRSQIDFLRKLRCRIPRRSIHRNIRSRR